MLVSRDYTPIVRFTAAFIEHFIVQGEMGLRNNGVFSIGFFYAFLAIRKRSMGTKVQPKERLLSLDENRN